MKVLRDIRDQGKGERTIVFSQFTSFLDLVEPFLLLEKIKFARCKCLIRILVTSLHVLCVQS